MMPLWPDHTELIPPLDSSGPINLSTTSPLICQLRGCKEPVSRNGRDPGKYCSHEHYAMDISKLTPWNDLQRRCEAFKKQHGLSYSAFSRLTGVSSLRHWFTHPHSRLSRKAVEQLAATLRVSAEQALEEAGGSIAEERWADQARTMSANRVALLEEKPQSRKARRIQAGSRRGGKAWAGRRQSAEHVAKRLTSAEASGAAVRSIEGLQRDAASLEGRLRRSLNFSLTQWRRQHDNQDPPERELRELAGRAAAKAGVCIARVVACWNTSLKTRGLRAIGGKLGDADRCDQLRLWLAEHDPPGGYGYWANSPETEEEWRRRHAQGCPTLQQQLKDGVQTPDLRVFQPLTPNTRVSP